MVAMRYQCYRRMVCRLRLAYPLRGEGGEDGTGVSFSVTLATRAPFET